MPALFVYPLVGNSLSASETDDRFCLMSHLRLAGATHPINSKYFEYWYLKVSPYNLIIFYCLLNKQWGQATCSHNISYSPSPISYSPSPISYSPSPISYSPSPVSYSPSPISYSSSPISYSTSPISYSPSPVSYSPFPVSYSPSPISYSPSPVSYSPIPLYQGI